jgi:hypothetical protein
MSDAIITRRGGSGGGGGIPETGVMLEVITTSGASAVKIEGYNLSETITFLSSMRRPFGINDEPEHPDVSWETGRSTRYGYVFSFHIPHAWLVSEAARIPGPFDRAKFSISVTVRSTLDSGKEFLLKSWDPDNPGTSGTALQDKDVTAVRIATFDIFQDGYFGLNPYCTITNNNAYLLAKAYDKDSGKSILLGPSGNSVNADITTGEDGGIPFSIPGDAFFTMYADGYANGTTGKVGLYDNNGTKRAEISLGSSREAKSVAIPGSTGPLRLNVVGKDVHLYDIHFE